MTGRTLSKIQEVCPSSSVTIVPVLQFLSSSELVIVDGGPTLHSSHRLHSIPTYLNLLTTANFYLHQQAAVVPSPSLANTKSLLIWAALTSLPTSVFWILSLLYHESDGDMSEFQESVSLLCAISIMKQEVRRPSFSRMITTTFLNIRFHTHAEHVRYVECYSYCPHCFQIIFLCSRAVDTVWILPG